ncbi:T9SS type A sorting domain-containing protein [Hymenobacter terricola]|uniref:T9SS type A sorting domain-containing protein n=1 Tax=Hymenobacter terricola TaxID=2819236 RepID=UPI001B300896|nr:T9SS type A sorting domain-containing protein [Hymenobacter terricola]
MKINLLQLAPAGAGRLGRCWAVAGLCAGLAGEAPAQVLPAATAATLTVPAALASAPFDVPHTVQVPVGFALAVYARVPGARFMALTPDGNLLVSQPGAGKVALVRPGSAGGTPVVTDFVTGLRNPHDLVFHTIGSITYLYLSESHQINRYVYQPGDLTGQGRQVVITGLPDASTPELGGNYGHQLKNLALDGNHKLYVSIASTCNACLSDTQSNPVRGAIYQYDADGSNGRLFARGLRNAEGLAFIPGTNTLWVVVNNRDNTPYPYNDATGNYGQVMTSYVDNHPPDEFTQVRDGGNYGWPFCNPNPDAGLDNMPFDLDYDWNRTGAVDPNAMDRINKGIQAHSAALGLTFLQGTGFPAAYAGGAVVALHGSWNRQLRTGYKVVYFPWNTATQTPGVQADLVTGFLDDATQNAWARPVDTAVDPQGNLLISDDQSGTIFKLSSAITPLPVILTAFEATTHGSDALLSWATASEKNNARFEVERSPDGRKFSLIGTVPGHGTTTETHSYRWPDPAAGRLGTVLYYRLRQVDADGSAQYSPVRAVRFAETTVQLYPNPAGAGPATLDLTALPPGTYTATVLDLLGRPVQAAQACAGGTRTQLMGTSRGAYLVRVQGAQFSQILRLVRD